MGIVTVNPATNIGKKKLKFSIIRNIANGIHAARLLLLAKKQIVISKVILVKFLSIIFGLIYV
jgi:hypothetical protein